VRLARSQPGPVLCDEWQHHPPVWDRVRRAVDRHHPPEPFLLRGRCRPGATGVGDYIERITGKDFLELGHQPRNPAALRRSMLAYAAATATSASWAKVRGWTGRESRNPRGAP
jgi:hypothetical protein